MVTGMTITSADYARRLKKGDLSLSDVFGYKRVLLPTGEPLRVYDQGDNLQSVYKMVNFYGDGNRASEHYTDFKPSVINNGTIKVEQELNDRDILRNYPDYYIEDSLSLLPENYVNEEEGLEEFIKEEKISLENNISNETLTLKDGKKYNKSDINSNMLEALGYTPKEIGKILKEIC